MTVASTREATGKVKGAKRISVTENSLAGIDSKSSETQNLSGDFTEEMTGASLAEAELSFAMLFPINDSSPTAIMERAAKKTQTSRM
jgi:hypothetical protein